MIIGGVTAAGKTGGFRTGFSSRYLPCKGFIRSESLRLAFGNKTVAPIRYSATARIRNLADTAWVDLPDVTYFQVTRRTGSGLDTALMTVRKPETWGIYGTEASLLRPSTRQCQININISAGSLTADIPLFIGSITTYAETHGASGGAINLNLSDVRDSLSREDAVSYAGSQTAYRTALRQGVSGLRYFGNDAIMGEILLPKKRDLLLSTLAGIPALSVSAYGPLYVGEALVGATNGLTFTYDDDAIVSISRNVDNVNSFNTVLAWGLVGSTVSSQTVADATDVGLRGTIQSPSPIGSAYMLLTDAVRIAEESIANALYGTVRLEIPFNPFLEPGANIGISSSRIGLSSSRLDLNNITHQYSVGSARTYIAQAQVVPL